MPNSKSITIACATDKHYVEPLTVMLQTVFAHLPTNITADIYLISDNLDCQQQISESLPDNARIHWVTGLLESLKDFPTWGEMPVSTYYKIKIGSLIPDGVEKVIWLDCDLFAECDLTELWNMEFDNVCLLACPDQEVKFASSARGVQGKTENLIPSGAKYFNAGVLLIDLKRWRSDQVEAACLRYLIENKSSIWYWDQEALNAALLGNWGELTWEWNYSPNVDPSSIQTRATTSTPKIIHFTGKLKPWKYPMRIYTARYFDLLSKSKWNKTQPKYSATERIIGMYGHSILRRFTQPFERMYTRLVRRRNQGDWARRQAHVPRSN